MNAIVIEDVLGAPFKRPARWHIDNTQGGVQIVALQFQHSFLGIKWYRTYFESEVVWPTRRNDVQNRLLHNATRLGL